MKLKRKLSSIMKLLSRKVNLLVLLILLIWFGYVIVFIWQNLSPVFIFPEAITTETLINQETSINQQLKDDVFDSMEQKTEEKVITESSILNPF